MITADNSEIAVKLRRCKSELATTGAGYIIFGIWSVLKIILGVFLGELALKSVLEELGEEPDGYLFVLVVYIIVIAVAVIAVLLLHLYVGIGAVRASRGTQKKGYLLMAKILFVVSILSLLSYAQHFQDLSNINIDDTTIASFLVDLTVTMLLFGMIRAAHMIKKLSPEEEKIA